MPISRVFVTRFFQLVTDRRFAEAERILERIKLKVHETEWNKGYFQALQGIILAKKSNDDEYAFLSHMNPSEEGTLKRYRREFLKNAKDKIYADYDRGFFSAWADYMRVLAKIKDAERKNAETKAEQSAGVSREKTAEKKSVQLPSRVETRPRKIVQTKLG